MRTRVPRRELEPLFRGARVDVGRLRRGGFARRPAAFDDLLDERLGLAHRQAARDDVARDAALLGFVGEREQRARVAHRQAARRDFARALRRAA